MKKKIIFGDGTSKIMEFNEEFLNKFRRLAVSEFAKYREGSVLDVTEDEKQELDYVIYKAFEKYNEKNAFSTLLVWAVKSYGHALANKNKSKKRNSSDFTFINLDYTLDNGDNSNDNMHSLIADDSMNHFELENSDLINYIKERCNKTEKVLLLALLNKITLSDVARITKTSNANISHAKKRMLKRLEKWIYEYNYCIA